MENLDINIENGVLTIVVDLNKNVGESKSGKSTIIASTRGNIDIPGREEKIGLNIYLPK